jgi:hypothetical protein
VPAGAGSFARSYDTDCEAPDMLEKFAEVTLTADLDALDDADRRVVTHAIRASQHLDEIFWRQTWSGAVSLRDRLRGASHPDNRRLLAELELMYGPYDRLDEHHVSFVAGVPARPAGAGFYPDDLTKEEFESWLSSHPRDRAAFESTTTLIRRQQGSLVAVPYREAYADLLRPAAAELGNAADAARHPSLARFLRSRAEALLSDDYYQSDLDWMDVEGNTIDVTIGPYETYEDLLFGYKASYESYVGVVDAAESANLQTYAKYLDALDTLLASRVPFLIKRGASSPIRVINLVYNAGDARAGVQTTAFNLPNDERVHQQKGTRKVMLRNVARAKFDNSMIPLATRLLDPRHHAFVTFDSYFTNVLLHEMAHSLGPSYLDESGRQTVRKSLRELYSPIEEAKADIVGLFFHQWLIDQKVLPAAEEERAYTSFLAGFFRSIRFGVAEAHGKANVLELNFLRERGGVHCDPSTGRFSLDLPRMRDATAELTDVLIGVEARGSYDEAARLLERHGQPDELLVRALQEVGDVPVDIRPRYPLEQTLAVF